MENRKTSELFSLLSFILPNCAFLLIPSTFSFIETSSFSDKFITCIIYLLPILLFISYTLKIKKLKNKMIKRKINISILKEYWFEIIIFIFGGTIGIYLLKNNFFYVGIPVILLAMELMIIKILEYLYDYNSLYYLWKSKKIEILNKNDLKIYDKWKKFFYSMIITIIYFIPVIIAITMPLMYFNILNVNIIAVISILGTCIIFFMSKQPFQQILDCKYDSFVKCQGRCTGYEQSGKGTGGAHTVLLDLNKQLLAFNSEIPVLRNGDKVIIIVGVHSEQIIGFYKVI